MAPNGIKITIRANNTASFPSNLLLIMSIIANTGRSNPKITAIGNIMKNIKAHIRFFFNCY